MNVYACYKNRENNWVIDGEKGRDIYPGDWEKDQVIAAYVAKNKKNLETKRERCCS